MHFIFEEDAELKGILSDKSIPFLVLYLKINTCLVRDNVYCAKGCGNVESDYNVITTYLEAPEYILQRRI